MKKTLFILTLCLSFFGTHAQDVIVLKNGTLFQARVIKIEGGSIHYSDWDDPEAHTKLISTYDVYSIRYEDGTTKVFDKQNKTVPIQSQSQSHLSSTMSPSSKEPLLSKKEGHTGSIGNGHILAWNEKIQQEVY